MCVRACQDFLRRPGLEDDLLDFCVKAGLDLMVLMTIAFTASQEPIRELAVYSPTAACREEVRQPPAPPPGRKVLP